MKYLVAALFLAPTIACAQVSTRTAYFLCQQDDLDACMGALIPEAEALFMYPHEHRLCPERYPHYNPNLAQDFVTLVGSQPEGYFRLPLRYVVNNVLVIEFNCGTDFGPK